jgi:GNAT superfamily N-acetyltransferase
LTIASLFTIREACADDRPVILDMLSRSLGFTRDATFDAFFSWKHDQNPFGPSPAWVACDGDRIAGFRTFARWEFEHPDGRVRRAVRAVDTATDPDYQGRGIFRLLTEHALEALTRDGVDFVFNTPNAKSRPGYLKMGWHVVGRVPASVRMRGLRAPARIARARVPAERWSLLTDAGEPAARVLADLRVATLLDRLAHPSGLRTRRSVEYLRWRYGFEPLRYRALVVDDEPRRGLAIFRVRRRGDATELALCEVLCPAGKTRAERALVRMVAADCDADYVIRLGGKRVDGAGYLRLPRQGPILTWRGVTATNNAPPALGDWRLQLGDIELF